MNGPSPPPNNRIYIGNIRYDADADVLKDVFQQYGTVLKVEVVRDKDTGRSKGFAFLDVRPSFQSTTFPKIRTDLPSQFTSVDEATLAIASRNDQDLGGRRVRVNYAQKPADRPPSRQVGVDMSLGGQGGVDFRAFNQPGYLDPQTTFYGGAYGGSDLASSTGSVYYGPAQPQQGPVPPGGQYVGDPYGGYSGRGGVQYPIPPRFGPGPTFSGPNFVGPFNGGGWQPDPSYQYGGPPTSN